MVHGAVAGDRGIRRGGQLVLHAGMGGRERRGALAQSTGLRIWPGAVPPRARVLCRLDAVPGRAGDVYGDRWTVLPVRANKAVRSQLPAFSSSVARRPGPIRASYGPC